MKSNKKKTIAVSGATNINSFGLSILDSAENLGKILAQKEIIVITNTSPGFSYWVAKGAYEAGGVVIGYSPAGNINEHIKSFRLPNDVFTFIVYTGYGYNGCSQMMLKSADGLLIGPGQAESIKEFLFGVESGIPVGVLEGEWKLDEAIKEVIGKNKKDVKVIFDKDLKNLADKILM